MRKLYASLVAAGLAVTACQRSPEETHGVDTTLNDAEPAAQITEPVADTNLSEPVPEIASEPMDGVSREEGGDYFASPDDTEPTPEASNVGARPAQAGGDPDAWISNDDYPPSAIRAEEQGVSEIAWTINAAGRIENCRVVTSSGSDALDRASCQAITRRGRYQPALNDDGEPVSSTASRRVRWVLPTR